MHIIRYEARYAAAIADLLNQYLPFEPETAETIDQAGGIRYLCINEHQQVVGYIAGYIIEAFEEDFPYFHEELQQLSQVVNAATSMYSSHFVVHPGYRKQGIGTKLVAAYTEAAEKLAEQIIVVGWVQSDSNHWAAQAQFVKFGYEPYQYVPRYFEPYQVDCPSCNGLCYCDAHIFIKRSSV